MSDIMEITDERERQKKKKRQKEAKEWRKLQ